MDIFFLCAKVVYIAIKSITYLNIEISSYVLARMFGRRLMYPGSLAFTNAIMGKPIMRITII